MVTYPSCHCRTNKKRPGSSKSSPPSLHCAPGGRQTPLGSNKDPGRVSRAPPWAAWRGAKHAALQSYLCTKRARNAGQIFFWRPVLFCIKKEHGTPANFFSGVPCSFASKKSTGRRPIFFLAFCALLHQKRARDAGQFFFWRSMLLILLMASLVVKGKVPYA